MKIIQMENYGQFKAREVFMEIAKSPPANTSLNYSDVQKRCRIIKELERQPGAVLRLEDADWQVFSQAVDTFPFGLAHPNLLAVVDQIKEARDMLQEVKEA